MKEYATKLQLRDGTMGAWIALPAGRPKGAVVAIMEIWGVNDTMRAHAREFAEAGYVCLVPDLFWRQEPGVELFDHKPADVRRAFDLYYDFDYDLAVRDMEDCVSYLRGFLRLLGGSVGPHSRALDRQRPAECQPSARLASGRDRLQLAMG